MKRLFVAVPVSEEVKEKIKPLLRTLKGTGADVNIVALENLHFTLKFLGDVEEKKIPEIVEKLSSLKQKKFAVTLPGVGVFPSRERINVIWIGTTSPELTSLAKQVNLLLNFIRSDQREERPHVTIARVKSGKNKEKVQEMVEKNKHTNFGTMVVENVVLMASELTPTGPVYSRVREFPFQ